MIRNQWTDFTKKCIHASRRIRDSCSSVSCSTGLGMFVAIHKPAMMPQVNNIPPCRCAVYRSHITPRRGISIMTVMDDGITDDLIFIRKR